MHPGPTPELDQRRDAITAAAQPILAPGRPDRPGLWTALPLADAARSRPDAVAHLGLRTTSPIVEDALGLAATGGRWTGGELRSRPDLEDLLEGSVRDVDAAAALALLWSGRGTDAYLAPGALTYAWLARTGRLPSRALHHQAAGQAMYLGGLTEQLRSWWPELSAMPAAVRQDLETDLAHPGLEQGPSAGRHDRWVALLGRRFTQHGLVAPTVEEGPDAAHLFDRLGSTAPAGGRGGPLVTVVIPCYQPDDGLLTSVASITAQTYADLEILLVDDASGPGYEELFTAATADARVRLLRLERNGGSYLARRAALEIARGEFVTTQDADDWSHPERIEHQMAALLDTPSAPASRSLAVRAKDDLTHQWFGYRSIRDNASSLLVRREVMSATGTFWPIRKSADSEYAERLARVVGPLAETRTPLAITRLRTGSLSRADFTYQWSHPDRIAFRGTYRAWHRTLPAPSSRETPDTVTAPEAPSLPPRDEDLPEVPPAFARGIDAARPSPDHLEVCLVADLSAPPGDRRHTGVRQLLDGLAGRPVGLWHLERPVALGTGRPEMHPDWYDLVLGRADLHVLTRTRPSSVDLALVADPDALLTAVAQPTAVTAAAVEVVLSAGDTEPGRLGLPLDLLAVSDACSSWWRVRPRWVVAAAGDAAAQERALGALREALPGLSVGLSVLAGGPPPRRGPQPPAAPGPRIRSR